MKDNIMVSVCCITYNHEKYIRNALESFLNQEVDFEYEIIVHDDCSTDGTTKIISEYYNKNSKIVVPIIQTDNKYSKGEKVVEKYILPKARGKYIALCEGDDFWCDNKKLKKQVDFLEMHPEYVACAHSNYIYNLLDNTTTVYHKVKKDVDLTFDDVCFWGGRRYHTSSIMYRSEFNNKPDFFYLSQAGDYPWALWLVCNGRIRYLHDVMSVYRMYVENSYSSSTLGDDAKALREQLVDEAMLMLIKVDRYTDYRHHADIARAMRRWEMETICNDKKYDLIIHRYLDIYYNKLGLKQTVIFVLVNRLPKVWKLMIGLHRLLKK